MIYYKKIPYEDLVYLAFKLRDALDNFTGMPNIDITKHQIRSIIKQCLNIAGVEAEFELDNEAQIIPDENPIWLDIFAIWNSSKK